MWYVICFAIGAIAGLIIMALIKKNKEVAHDTETIETIVKRSIEAYKQNKKTEEIVAEIDELLKQ